MIVIELSGGLGNQMFQYALYLQMKQMNKEVCIDSSLYLSNKTFCELELTKVFGLQFDEANHFLTACVRGYGYNDTVVDKIKYKVAKITQKASSTNYVDCMYADKIDGFQPQIFELKNTILQGYWQSEKYFQSASEYVRNAFVFRNISDDNLELADKMKRCNSVSLHIRRGDYLTEKNKQIYGEICTLDYYERAIALINNRVQSPYYFIFSDDVLWAKENICCNDNVEFVDINSGNKSFQDMYLMTQCKHSIIANSSFSWWGAWLGDGDFKDGRIVICPKKWLNNHNMQDIYCSDWIRL